MMKKILIQTFCCLLIVFTFMVAESSTVPEVQRGTEAVLNYMSVDYTREDIMAVAGKASDAMVSYGEPIDKKFEGDETLVYAVGGGKVTAVGENEEIGKYVRITHGNKAESLYGNLKTVKVNKMSNVKRGEIIGIYSKEDGKEFYYSFNEF